MSELVQSQIEGTLRDLDALLAVAPEDVARLAERIRFAAMCVNQFLGASAGPARLDIALEILDGHLRRAEAFIDAAASEAEAPRAA